MNNPRIAIAAGILLIAVAIGCKLPGFGRKAEPAANSSETPANTAQPLSNAGTLSPSGDPLAYVIDASLRFTDVQAFQSVMDT
jgi:hypothetical protein